MLSINTNIPGFIAQKFLNNSTQMLNIAIERMSTGFKINHASDNAANYSIATNMTTRIGAYQVAESNTAMGLDMVTTASESLSLISDKLARLRALSEQAANGTYGEKSLNAIDTEARSIMDELFRTKNNAEYNGTKLFGESIGPDMSKLALNADGFIQDIQRRDTNSMTSLDSVDESAVLAKGTYSISSAEELAKLARMQNNGKITDGSEFVLGADIDLSSFANWTPIGWENANLQTNKAFAGTFDGNGFKIKNINCTQNTKSAYGLFGSIKNATFKNLGIENANIKGRLAGSIAGCIVNNSTATFDNCYAKDININGRGYIEDTAAGGLVGGSDKYNSGSFVDFSSCYVTNATIGGLHWGYGGGILGLLQNATFQNCFSSELEITGIDSYLGGLAGLIRSFDIENCFAKGKLSRTGHGASGGDIGGLIAGGDGRIKDCYFEGTLDSTYGYIGGIMGNCFGSKPIFIENYSVNATLITNVPKTGIGGIAGCMDCEGGYVKNCSFNGTITGSIDNAIVGEGIEGKLEVKDCTYNKSLCGELKGIGNGLGTSSNITDMVLTTTLQVGIYGNENSQIDFDTFLQLDELRGLYISGLKQDNAFEIIDNLSQKVSAIQTQLGAAQNRLESALDEISTQYENLLSSRSTLRDADVSEVSSDYIKQQILQQASSTLLSTANQTPALALQLI